MVAGEDEEGEEEVVVSGGRGRRRRGEGGEAVGWQRRTTTTKSRPDSIPHHLWTPGSRTVLLNTTEMFLKNEKFLSH